MRLWSIHPSYLDAKGLVALWREGLLARHVLLGKTKGYRNHPQLCRFRTVKDPMQSLDAYLTAIIIEAKKRGYSFDASKINISTFKGKIKVTDGQIRYEAQHLSLKLEKRDQKKFREFVQEKNIRPHSLFKIIPGKIEP